MSGGAFDVAVVGAGIAGLAAASRVAAAGRRVVVLEKARGVGGRMATRRAGGVTYDHGAQFFTVRSPEFADLSAPWRERGVVVPWPGDPEVSPASVRWVGAGGMTAPAKVLAEGLEVVCGVRVEAAVRDRGVWRLKAEGRAEVVARALVLTCPVPQALQVLTAGGFELPRDVRERLQSVAYDPCWTLLVRPAGDHAVPAEGLVPGDGGPLAWVADNGRKGVSAAPALTVQASAAWSAEHVEDAAEDAGAELARALAPWCPDVWIDGVHRWRYARVSVPLGEPFAGLEAESVAVAGDGMLGPRVEAAARSGLAAAAFLMQSGALT